MKKNIGNVERAIRIVVGIILLSFIVIGPKTLWGLIGLLPLVTGYIGWCPTYALFGISTCKNEKSQKPPKQLPA